MRNRYKPDRLNSFSIFGSVLLLSGVGLICFSIYVFYKNLYPVIFWEKTKGKVIGIEESYDQNKRKFYVFEKASYVDKEGNQFEITASTSAGTKEANIQSTQEVTIYYNPENSEEAMIWMWRNLLPIIMFPFGLFLIFLGWPFESKMEYS